MAAKEEAMAVEDMEVGLDYWLPWDKLELKTAAPKSCAEIRLSPTYLGFRVILISGGRGGEFSLPLSLSLLSFLPAAWERGQTQWTIRSDDGDINSIGTGYY